MAGTPQIVSQVIKEPYYQTMTVPVFAASAIANADELTDYIFGFPYEVIKIDFVAVTPITTAAKTATLTPYIDGVAVPGTVTALAGAVAKGVVKNVFTATGLPTYGTSVSKFKLTGSSVTAFAEGAGYFVITFRATGAADQ